MGVWYGAPLSSKDSYGFHFQTRLSFSHQVRCSFALSIILPVVRGCQPPAGEAGIPILLKPASPVYEDGNSVQEIDLYYTAIVITRWACVYRLQTSVGSQHPCLAISSSAMSLFPVFWTSALLSGRTLASPKSINRMVACMSEEARLMDHTLEEEKS